MQEGNYYSFSGEEMGDSVGTGNLAMVTLS